MAGTGPTFSRVHTQFSLPCKRPFIFFASEKNAKNQDALRSNRQTKTDHKFGLSLFFKKEEKLKRGVRIFCHKQSKGRTDWAANFYSNLSGVLTEFDEILKSLKKG